MIRVLGGRDLRAAGRVRQMRLAIAGMLSAARGRAMPTTSAAEVQLKAAF